MNSPHVASSPEHRGLLDLLEEVNNAMPLENFEIPQAESEFMVRMIKQWWNGPFTHETVAVEDVLELKRLHAKYCGEPSEGYYFSGPASEQS